MGDCSIPFQILEALHEQRKTSSERFCDVILKCGPNRMVHAHSCVLAASSGFFTDIMATLIQPQEENRPRFIELEVGELFSGLEEAFEEAISLLYLGQSSNLNDDTLQLLAQKLDLKFVSKNRVVNVDTETPKLSLKEEVVTSKPNRDSLARNNAIKMDVSFCHKCDLLFTSQDEFLMHKMLNCTRKFTCKPCGTMFNRVQQLLEHLMEVRHGETSCSVCSFSCVSSQEMEDHFRKHLQVKDKPYFCQQCDCRFGSRNALTHHIPKHSVETPFVCEVCSRGFKWKHALTSHMNKHSSDKKYLCQSCGFATAYLSVFKNHQRIHTGQTIKCSLPGCTFQTVRKQNLAQHQLTHSKERPHQCEVCGRSFSLVKNLRRHSRQHDFTAKKHVCQVDNCSFSTLRGDKFAEHMRRSHGARSGKAGQVNGGNIFDTINPPNKTIEDTTKKALISSTMILSDVKLDEAAAALFSSDEVSLIVTGE